MKRVFALVTMALLAASLLVAQDTGGDKQKLNPQPLPPGRHPMTMEKTKKGHHKGGKKGKKAGSVQPMSHKGGKKTTDPNAPGTNPPTQY